LAVSFRRREKQERWTAKCRQALHRLWEKCPAMNSFAEVRMADRRIVMMLGPPDYFRPGW
jgi:hypothetical protein